MTMSPLVSQYWWLSRGPSMSGTVEFHNSVGALKLRGASGCLLESVDHQADARPAQFQGVVVGCHGVSPCRVAHATSIGNVQVGCDIGAGRRHAPPEGRAVRTSPRSPGTRPVQSDGAAGGWSRRATELADRGQGRAG